MSVDIKIVQEPDSRDVLATITAKFYWDKDEKTVKISMVGSCPSVRTHRVHLFGKFPSRDDAVKAVRDCIYEEAIKPG